MSEDRATTDSCDCLIVGAGPAGMAAAVELARAGRDVLVADENPAPGGQIYRNVAAGAPASIFGAEYVAGRPLVEAFAASGARHAAATTVFLIERRDDGGFDVALSHAGAARLVRAKTVLIATGALERPFPIPGWTLPGVITAGAAQTLLKQSALAPDAPVVLAGTGPLLFLLAAQYARAGISVAALLDATPKRNFRGALGKLPGFLASDNFAKGLRLIGEAARSTRLVRGVTALVAEGEGRLERVRFVAHGREETLEARALLLHQGVVPQIHLAMSAGVPHRWSEARLAFEPERDGDGATPVDGLFIAGDSGAIAGAEAARAAGRLAGLAIAARLGARAEASALDAARAAHAKALRGRAFVDALFRPADHFRKPADDVIVCRCEEVTAGAIRDLAQRGAQGPNQAKAFSRAGMGPCQGRLCGLTVAELMAEARGESVAAIGHMNIRAPVKPVTVAELAALARQD
ncbi:MAG: FAD-dependent oxidoreductase [Rhizobiales bacterium]|nr:FAD-dependent oxidoreductase [Hyphomicrobiales bacterium]